MDRYEFDIKIEQIKKLMKKKDFATAVKIADTIDWKKVKENPLLIIAADVYEISGKYDEAREVLLLAYEKTGLGRQLAYRLCRLSVKRGDFKEAEEFYDEFSHNSPYDAGKYILQYEMAKGKGESLDKQISILETFIGEDMDDRWAYELAKLYHKAHLSDKCVELCDTIILWFADGKYVEKALELKQLYVPLSENQRLKYEAQKSKKDRMVSEAVQSLIDDGVVEEKGEGEVVEDTADGFEENDEEIVEEAQSSEEETTTTELEENEILDQVHEMDIDIDAIRVKDFSINNKYDTINIQKELAKSVSTLFDNTVEIFKPVAPKSAEEEEKEDDQIEGQMSLEEVLAMFESGELQTRSDEDVQDEETNESEEVVEEPEESEEIDEIEALSKIIADEIAEDIEEEILEEISEQTAEEEIEEISEEIYEEEISEEESDEFIEEIIEETIDDELEDTLEEIIEDVEDIQIEEKELTMFDLKEDFDTEESIDEIVDEVEAEDVEDIAVEAVAENFAEEVEEDIEENIEENFADEEGDEEDSDEEIEEESEAVMDEEHKEKSEPVATPAANSVKQADIAKRELKNFISKFTGIKGLDKQILKVLQTALKTDAEPVKFIFVKGEVRSGKTTLAIEVIKVINRIIQRKDQKIAKIKGISLNDKSMEALMETLSGSDILIERVSDMDIDVFIEFIDVIKEESKPRVVIFEDEKNLADAFIEELPEEYAEFTNIIDIKLNEIRDWATIAEKYAKERGYTIDAMGTLALSAKIDQLKAVTKVIHRSHIEELIDKAILDAEKFSIKKMFGKLFGRSKSELKPLTEKNFINL